MRPPPATRTPPWRPALGRSDVPGAPLSSTSLSTALLPHPRPPRQEIDDLVRSFLGPRRRAGHGILPEVAAADEDLGAREGEVYRAAGFTGPTRIEIPGHVVVRSADDVVASVFSLSSAAPHLFGDRVGDVEAGLRQLLAAAGPDGRFSEQMAGTTVDVWRR